MSRAGRVVTYAKLLTAVWGADCREEVEYLRTFVRQLRKKIEDDPSNPALSAHRCLRRLSLCRCADVPGRVCRRKAKRHRAEEVPENEVVVLVGNPSCINRQSELRLFVVVQQAEDVVLLEAIAPFQEVELDGKAQPGDLPPSCFTSFTVASMVPPVASRSSTRTTLCPGAMASMWISSVSDPYSRS